MIARALGEWLSIFYASSPPLLCIHFNVAVFLRLVEPVFVIVFFNSVKCVKFIKKLPIIQ